MALQVYTRRDDDEEDRLRVVHQPRRGNRKIHVRKGGTFRTSSPWTDSSGVGQAGLNRKRELQQQASRETGFLNTIRDVFDANTASDRLKRLNSGRQEMYQGNDTFTNPRTLVDVSSGITRSVVGLGQGISGLYDLATPGTGSNRFSDKLDEVAKAVDDVQRFEGNSDFTYRTTQGATDVASIAAGGAGFAKLANKALPKVSTRGATLIGDVGVDVLTGLGQNASRDRKTTWADVALNTIPGVAVYGGGRLVNRIRNAGSPTVKVANDIVEDPNNVLNRSLENPEAVAREIGVNRPGDANIRINSTLNDELIAAAQDRRILPGISRASSRNLKLGSDAVDRVDFDTIKQYANDILDGNDIPPIVVSREGGEWLVQDGKHRLIAANALGVEEVPIVRQVSPTEATTPAVAREGTGAAVSTAARQAKDNADIPAQSLGSEAEAPPVTRTKPAESTDEAVQRTQATEDPDFDINQYVEENSFDVKPTKVKGRGPIRDFKGKMVDSRYPIFDAIKDIGRENDYTKADIQAIVDKIDYKTGNVPRVDMMHAQFIQDSGLEEIIQTLGTKKELQNLDQYLIAKRAIEVANTTGKKTGRDLAKDARIVREFAPTYEPVAKEVRRIIDQMMDYMVDAELISSQTRNTLRREFPDYVPLNRVIDEIEDKGVFGQSGTASVSDQTVVRKMKGSERDIVSPIQSLVVKSRDMLMQGERNKAARALVNLRTLDGYGDLFKKVKPGDVSPNRSVSVLRNGKKIVYETTPEIAAAAKNLNVAQNSTVARILFFGTRLLRLGATGINAPFAAANVTKDYITSTVFSRHPGTMANPTNYLRAISDVVRNSDTYKAAKRTGAAGNIFEATRGEAPTSVARIRAGRSPVSKASYVVTHPKELFRSVENLVGVSEQIGRTRTFAAAGRRLNKKGVGEVSSKLDNFKRLSPEEQAALDARQATVDFFAKGEWGQVLNGMYAYLNAGIQGGRRFITRMNQNPVKTGASVATGLMTPVAMATVYNLNDPERAEIYADISDFEKENNIILIPPGAEQDDRGLWKVIKIPLPPGLSSLTKPVRDGVETAMIEGKDFEKKALVEAFIGSTSPVPTGTFSQTVGAVIPDTFRPLAEQATNMSFFTGRQLEPDYLQDRDVEDRAFESTTGTAKVIAEKIGVAPTRVDAFIRAYGAGVGTQFLNLTDNALAKMNVIEEDEVKGESALANVQRRFSRAFGGEIEEAQRQKKDEILSSLSNSERADWDALHTYDFDSEGEIQFRDKPLYSQQRASIYLNSPKVFEVDRKLAIKEAQEKGKPIDPIFLMEPEVAQSILLAKLPLPGESSELKQAILYEQPWYNEWKYLQDFYYQAKERYNKEQGYEDFSGRSDDYPTAGPELQELLDRYFALPSGTGQKTAMANQFPQISEYFDRTRAWKNKERAKLGLPPIEDNYGYSYSGFGSSSGGLRSPTIKLKSNLSYPGIKISGIRKGSGAISPGSLSSIGEKDVNLNPKPMEAPKIKIKESKLVNKGGRII